MISIKHIQLFLLASLLFALQPAMAGINSSEDLVVNHQEDFSYFKTKNSKALVLHQNSIQTLEVSETFQVNYSAFSAESLSLKSKKENTHFLNYCLIDRRGMLTSQIFPFHFHF